jgi:hypothetical protein
MTLAYSLLSCYHSCKHETRISTSMFALVNPMYAQIACLSQSTNLHPLLLEYLPLGLWLSTIYCRRLNQLALVYNLNINLSAEA